MRYVTVAKLQDKFNGEASQNTVRKLIDRMVNEGMVEAKGNRRLGEFKQAEFFMLIRNISLMVIAYLIFTQASELSILILPRKGLRKQRKP